MPRSARTTRRPVHCSARATWVLVPVLALLLVWLVAGWTAFQHPRTDVPARSDALLVLGPPDRTRMAEALRLMDAGVAPVRVVADGASDRHVRVIGHGDRGIPPLHQGQPHRTRMTSPATVDASGRIQVLGHHRVTAGFPFLPSGLVRVGVTTTAHLRSQFGARAGSPIQLIRRVVGRRAVAIFALYSGQMRRRGFTDKPGRQPVTHRVTRETGGIFILTNSLEGIQGVRMPRVGGQVMHRLMAFRTSLRSGISRGWTGHPEKSVVQPNGQRCIPRQ